jgi:type I restriction-modification system DNA methylase subunit
MCNKIKKLKLRGTKFEPLLLQLVMMSLNKKARAVLIVPDILLFGDSAQAIETRKYLVENFLVKKIIKINDNLNVVKGSHNSILYFEQGTDTKSIEISQISLANNEIMEESVMNLKIEQIVKNNFSLYYKNHEDIEKMLPTPNND